MDVVVPILTRFEGKYGKKYKKDDLVNFIYENYQGQIDSLCQNSPLAKMRDINSDDVVNLGQLYDRYQSYESFILEEGGGTAADLGPLPIVALDILTGFYGASIIPIVANIQLLPDEAGMVYFKELVATATRGSVKEGDKLHGGRTAPDAYAVGYASESNEYQKVLKDPAPTLKDVFENHPIRPFAVQGTLFDEAGKPIGKFSDNGEGHLFGYNCQGRINYKTGAFSLHAGYNEKGEQLVFKSVYAEYASDLEGGGPIAGTKLQDSSVLIKAKQFALQSSLGIFKAWALRSRFGLQAQEDQANSLTQELVGEIGNTLIYTMNKSFMKDYSGNIIEWSAKPDTSVSWFEHKQELKDVISWSEGKITDQSGTGVVNVLMAGSQAAPILSNLPGFVKAGVSASGPHYYGSLDGIPVIRVPKAANTPFGLQSDEILTGFRGTGGFDTPAVLGSFMPLYIENNIPSGENLLSRRGVAASWSAVECLIPSYLGKIRIKDIRVKEQMIKQAKEENPGKPKASTK